MREKCVIGVITKIKIMKTATLFSMLLATTITWAQMQYPATKKSEQTDNYHGTSVADPYRWLEDDRSAETAEWVKAENKVTFDYLDKIAFRKTIYDQLEKVVNYPKYSAPNRKGEWFYFSKNDGLQNQSILYRQKGLDGTPEVVIDPNKLSTDGTTRLSNFGLSKDGKFAVVGTSKGGSDWQEYGVMDMTTLKMLADKIEWVKVSGASWQGDGFYYSRYPKPEGSALAAKNENHQVYYHKLGTTQADDKLIFEDKANPLRFNGVYTTDDETFAFLSIRDGKKSGNSLYYKKVGETNFKPLVAEITDFDYSVIDNDGDKLILSTNDNAPNKKLMLIDTKIPQKSKWKVLLAEKPEVMDGVATAGNKLFISYLKDVATHTYVYDYSGKLQTEVPFPSIGTAGGFGGEKDDKFVFYTFTSFTYPPTIFRYDIATQQSSIFRKPEISFDPSGYETKQVFYTSRDGAVIPMFLTYKKGLQLNGKNPTLLYGYGGFNISLNPSFSATRIPFLDNGGVYAQANLRGGGEYGEKWHEQGMKLKKQNVFDDFITAAEYLIKENYTSKNFLAMQGGSNGGLLVGAVLNQRPDLFKVAIPQVGVMDMLRFQKFTIGWNWVDDYGSSDNMEEFKKLYRYSPIHNIQEGLQYPATLITTADHDDRVVPAHSFKYAATLQEKAHPKSGPLLIRIDTNSGHGASNLKKNLETTADIYAFIFYNMGLTWK